MLHIISIDWIEAMDNFERFEKFLKISVIIPVYRTEDYLKECVESVWGAEYRSQGGGRQICTVS